MAKRSLKSAVNRPARRPKRARAAPTALTPGAFKRLFDNLREGVYIGLIGPDETATLAANSHLRQMFGWTDDTPAADVRPFDAERFVDDQARATLLRQLTEDHSLEAVALRLRRLDGTAVWIEMTVRAEPLTSSTHRVEVVMRDVTERRRLEDGARELNQQLAQAEKLAALGQTMSGVAHELNNPLATILACAERLAGRRLDPSTRRDLGAIHDAAERAARIVRNLQTFARKRQTTRATVDLNEIVRDTLALRAYEQRAAHVETAVDLTSDLPPIFVDRHQIQQILLNLITNAEQAMIEAHGRGTLTVKTWRDPERDAVMLEVTDDGPGIPDDVQARIFDPFYTTKPVGRGTGLGLTVAYAIAEEHGGRLSVHSEPGRGTSFFVALPVSGITVRTPAAAPVKPVPAVPKGTRALVIEDEDALGGAVAAAMTDAGFRVDRAADGEEGLLCLGEQHYDVIICDLKMPNVDGMTLFREASARQPQIARRLIFMTGDVAGTEAEQFLSDSGCRWVPKPFRLRDLVRQAREVVD
jgi:two-component system NtrC family sensor kinase